MSNVAQNLNVIREKIRDSCLRRASASGKYPRLGALLTSAHGFFEGKNREPRLVAVSKIQKKELIVEAYEWGQRHFGENYVNELIEKSTNELILKSCPDIRWHFVGHLQRNKVGKLLSVPNLFVVETVDSEKLADALNSGMEKLHPNNDTKLNVFIQVNTSGEETKSGCLPEEVTEIVKHALEKCNRLNIMGLMTIGKYGNYKVEEGINPDFECLLSCRTKVCENLNIEICNFEMSMGMSNDFEHAIEVGSTNIRVGTSIFGARSNNLNQNR